MITKQQLLDSMQHEVNVIKHLATKVPADRYEWRPTPGQRSMGELMQYLTVCALSPTLYAVNGNWDSNEEVGKEMESSTSDNFAERMDAQMAKIAEALADIDEHSAAKHECQMPWGAPCTQGDFLGNAPLKALTAYRMQFFLYLKQGGCPELSSPNCWIGMDPPAAD